MSEQPSQVVHVLADLAAERARLRANLEAARSGHPAGAARQRTEAAVAAQLDLARVERTTWAVVASIREAAAIVEERRGRARRQGTRSDVPLRSA